MSKIPVVIEDLIEVFNRDLMMSSNIEGTNHLIDIRRDIKRDQPALADLLLTEMRLVKNPKEKGYLAHGAFIIYHALRVQLEIDEMNEAWGE